MSELAWQLRMARADDVPALSLLFDMANMGDISAIWGREAPAGQSWLDVCARHMNDPASEIHFGKAVVADVGGVIAGMLLFFSIAPPQNTSDVSALPAHLRVFAELRALAPPCVFLRDMAVLPAHRGQRIATRLLDTAIIAGKLSGLAHVTAIVHETNVKLLAHYAKRGMHIIARRPVFAHVTHAADSQWCLLQMEQPLEDVTSLPARTAAPQAMIQEAMS